MTAWIKIGLRNLFKNARRSAITALAIAFAYATVNLFGGFAQYMHSGNQNVAIYAMAQGHLTVFKRGFLSHGRRDLLHYTLTADEVKAIEEICSRRADVDLVTPQLEIAGLLSNGEVSTIFVAQGVVPSARRTFLRRLEKMAVSDVKPLSERFEGRPLEDGQDYGVGVARGLANLLKLQVGSSAVAFANTVEGQMNAMDVEVFLLFNAGSEQLNDKFMMVPFAFAQQLYDTQGADRVAVLLSDTKLTETVRTELEQACRERGLDVEIKTWNELSEWYRKVKSMFDTIFRILFAIVFVIVVMSVINTMGMAVMERTREIGTLRALGLKRSGIRRLFAIESLLLGLFGSAFGVILTIVGWGAVKLLKPTWMPPGMSNRFVVWIEFVPSYMVVSFVALLLLSLIASLVPARRAARRNIVDSLGHV